MLAIIKTICYLQTKHTNFYVKVGNLLVYIQFFSNAEKFEKLITPLMK